MNSLFSLDPFSFGEAQDVHSLLQSCGSEEDPLFRLEKWEDIGSLCSEYNSYHDSISQKVAQLSENQEQPFPDLQSPSEFHLDVVFPPTEPSTNSSKQVETKKVELDLITSTSLKLLNNYRSGKKRPNREEFDEKSFKKTSSTDKVHRKLSTEEIMKVAGSWYIQFGSQKDKDLSMSRQLLSSFDLGLDDEETKDVELVCFLLVSAEKVGNQLFYQASKLLTQCDHLSANSTSPIQRVVYYFAEALRVRINQEIGINPVNGFDDAKQNLEETMMTVNPVLLTFHQELPFSQVVSFTGIQTIIDSVANEKKVHLIDLGVRTGMHWTILIQALASRHENPLEFLKITAIGDTTQRTNMEDTGERLLHFADSMNFKFSFMVITVSDLMDLKEDFFEIEAAEAVIIYSPMLLRTMLPWPDRLETLMEVIRKLKPSGMVVTEMEANQNSSSFFNRFTEALFYYSALFDCIEFEASTNEKNKLKMNALGESFGEAVQNIIAMEGEERTTRSVGVDVWRSFFARFKIMQRELSQSSLDQASLILKKFNTGTHCNLSMNGECLTVGWKGTPILSVSAWKFY